MFFFVSKIFSFLFTPITWIFTLLLVAVFSRSPKWKKRSLIAGIALLYFFSNSFMLEEVSRLWEVPATSYSDLKIYDAGIVLGGMLDYDVTLARIQFQRGADRLFQAVELYKMGRIEKIFFVGGSGSIEFAHLKEGVFVKRYLLTLGIPEEDIWIESESRNTRENAVFAKALIEKQGYDKGRFLLVTSGIHMRRALRCFNAVQVDVSPYSVDRNASPVRRFTPDHLLIPNVNTMIWWNAVIHEWMGMVIYKIKGYI